MQIEQNFTIARTPEDVFAFIVQVDNLTKWRTIKTYATPLTDGPLRVGRRVREGSKIGPREWEQVVEVTEFDPARVFAVKGIEGPPSSGRWTMQPEAAGTRVHFHAEFEAPRLLAPLLRPLTQRQFRVFHDNLRRELERA